MIIFVSDENAYEQTTKNKLVKYFWAPTITRKPKRIKKKKKNTKYSKYVNKNQLFLINFDTFIHSFPQFSLHSFEY